VLPLIGKDTQVMAHFRLTEYLYGSPVRLSVDIFLTNPAEASFVSQGFYRIHACGTACGKVTKYDANRRREHQGE